MPHSQPNLINGEDLDFRTPLKAPITNVTREAINEKYVAGDVRIVTEQARYPLHTIVTMLDSGDYDLNPEFQRRHRWSTVKQSRLIESFIMNVPIPPVFLYEIEYSHYEVMDGLQRLTAISDFYKGVYALRALTEWPELEGLRYGDLPEQVRRGIDRRYLSSIILLRETAKSNTEAQRLKQLVFERINSGGEKLEPQESRNALYNGPLNQLCIELSSRYSFRKMWRIPTHDDYTENPPPPDPQINLFDYDEDESDNHEEKDTLESALLRNKTYQKMQDVELVLRFFAHRQLHRSRLIDINPESGSKEPGRLRDYLDEFLRKGNGHFSPEVLAGLKKIFIETSDLVYDVFGKSAFWLFRRRANSEDGWVFHSRPAKIVYDPLMFAVSQRLHKKDEILRKASAIRDGIEDFHKENEELLRGRSTNYADVVARRRIFQEYLDRFI